MTRHWYVAPYRVVPGSSVPGRYTSGCYWSGPSPKELARFRGPVTTCTEAVGLALAWRQDGKRSDLWLVLVERGYASHTMKFDDERVAPTRPSECLSTT